MDDFIVNYIIPNTKKLPIKIIESNTKEKKPNRKYLSYSCKPNTLWKGLIVPILRRFGNLNFT